MVCQNETLSDSQAGLAEDLRREIREQIKAGKSDKEIIAFLTGRYGQFILYRPRVTPTTYLLWFGPFVLLVGRNRTNGWLDRLRCQARLCADPSIHRVHCSCDLCAGAPAAQLPREDAATKLA